MAVSSVVKEGEEAVDVIETGSVRQTHGDARKVRLHGNVDKVRLHDSMSPRGTGDMGLQSASISSLVSSAGGGGVHGSILTSPLVRTAAIGSSFAAAVAETAPAWLDEDPASLYTTNWRSAAVLVLSSSLYTTSAVGLMLSSS
jgi:hypothetical protein